MQPYDSVIEHDMKGFFATLSEKDKRRYVAIEAKKLGHGGQEYLSRLLGCSTKTIKRGLVELANPEEIPVGRVRRQGGGRKAYDKKSANQ
jgi:DeoR/GlpR family transcriptional regulator of sugar metabolism